MENTDVFLGLHDFLERMRKPSAADFVKSIKSFIVSISNNAPDPEKDSAAVQEFFSKMDAAFREHPLWSGCSEEELDSADEGLEKYVMTKLFARVFASSLEDAKQDELLSEKMALVQQFIRPENLDIKPVFQNETSWLLAQKELQKINMYKSPRDKLVCILNCCKVINNLLLNASLASNDNHPGADEFLPVLIYVTIKANPPQFHSNLLYIQRYRHQSKLVGEAAYYFTNMLSVESFISNIDSKSISMEDEEYERNMEFARALLPGPDGLSKQTDQSIVNSSGEEPTVSKHQGLTSMREKDLLQSKSSDNLSGNKEALDQRNQLPIKKTQSLSDMENQGAAILLKDNQLNKVFEEYPYLFANVGDLTVNDVEGLLNNYKQVVFKYVCLSQGLGGELPPISQAQVQSRPETSLMAGDEVIDSDSNLNRDSDQNNYSSSMIRQFEEENVHSKLLDAKVEDANVKAPEVKDEDVPEVSEAENENVDHDNKFPGNKVSDLKEPQVGNEEDVGPHGQNQDDLFK